MKNYQTDIIESIRLYLSGELEPEERQKLERWLEEKEENRAFFERICAERNFAEEFRIFRSVDVQQGWEKLAGRIGQASGKRRKLTWMRYAAILAIPLAVTMALFWFGREGKTVRPEVASVLPGQKEVTLTLAGGKQVRLKHGQAGEVWLEKEAKVVQDSEGIVYTPAEAVTKELCYHELEVPRGGEFKITLSDGTRVYLNSGSKLRYPEIFAKAERRVFFSGEAYFEVSRDTQRPFYVEAEQVGIKVYGTEFNVNTLKPDRIQTVLVKGQIGIRALQEEKEYPLVPEQLADYDRSSGRIEIKKVDVRPYVAWKEGYFCFENESLEEILNTLCFWYDVQVFWQNQAVRELHFTGMLKRYDRVDTILEAITETTGVVFVIKGSTITVTK